MVGPGVGPDWYGRGRIVVWLCWVWACRAGASVSRLYAEVGVETLFMDLWRTWRLTKPPPSKDARR